MLVKVTNMWRVLQSQNRVDGDYEKTTGLIYLKFWQKFLLKSTTEIQKKVTSFKIDRFMAT